MTKPVVGVCVAHSDISRALFHAVRDGGMVPSVSDHDDPLRWEALVSDVGRENIVCVIDDDPQMVITATALGVDGVIYDQPWNRFFSWHLRATGIDDARQGLSYSLKIWRDKRHG